MTSKNETRVLLFSLLITLGLVGVGLWLIRGTLGVFQPSPHSATVDSAPAAPVQRFAQVQAVPSGTFNYAGSTTWAPIRGTVDLEIQKARPEFRLNYIQQEGVAPSTQSGLELLAQGEVAFSLASRLPSNEVLKDFENQGIRLRLVPVADSFEAVAVHLSLPISELTIGQINAIRSGRITNWQEVGGPDLPIQQFDRNVNPDVIETKPDSTENFEFFTTPLEAIRKLAEVPGGFYLHTAPLLVPQCTIKTLAIVNSSGQTVTPYQEPLVPPSECLTRKNQVNLTPLKNGDYPSELKNTLYVVIKLDGQTDQQIGEAYANFLLSDEGQSLLERAGYLRIR